MSGGERLRMPNSHLISGVGRADSGRTRAGLPWTLECWGRRACRRAPARAPAWACSRSRARPRPPGTAGASRAVARGPCPSRPAPPALRPKGRVVSRTAPAWRRPSARPVRWGLPPRVPAPQFYQWSLGPIFGSGALGSANRAPLGPPPAADVTARRRPAARLPPPVTQPATALQPPRHDELLPCRKTTLFQNPEAIIY